MCVLRPYKCLYASAEQFILCISGKHVAMLVGQKRDYTLKKITECTIKLNTLRSRSSTVE